MKYFAAAALLASSALAVPTLETRQEPSAPKLSPQQVAQGGSDILKGLSEGLKKSGLSNGPGVGNLLQGLAGGLGSAAPSLSNAPPGLKNVALQRRQAPPPRESPAQVAKGGSDVLQGVAKGFKSQPGLGSKNLGNFLNGISGGLAKASKDLPNTPPPAKGLPKAPKAKGALQRRQAPPPRESPAQVAKGGSEVLQGVAKGFKSQPGLGSKNLGNFLNGISGGLAKASQDLPNTAPPAKGLPKAPKGKASGGRA